MKTRLKEILSNESEMPDDCEVYVHDPLGDMPLLISLLKKKANAQGKSVRFLSKIDRYFTKGDSYV